MRNFFFFLFTPLENLTTYGGSNGRKKSTVRVGFKVLLFLTGFISLFLIKNSFAESKDTSKKEALSLSLSKIERKKAIVEAIKVAEGKIEKEEKEPSLLRRIIANIHPYLDLSTGYSTNIYKTPADEEQDFVIITIPGLKFETKGKRESLKFDFCVEAITYALNPDANRQNLRFTTSFGFTSPQRFSLSLDDVIQRNYIPKSEIESGAKGFARYLQNTFDFVFGLERHRLGFDIGFKRDDYDYAPAHSLLNDHNESVYTLTGYFRIAPKTRLLLEYNHGKIRYTKKPSPSKDSDYNQLRLGAKGDLTPKLTGTIKIGYQGRDYEEKRDWSQPVILTDLEYRAGMRTSYLLSLKRTAEESTYTDQNYYEENKMSLSCSHRLAFNPKFKLSLSGGYGYERYPESGGVKRRDKIKSLDLGLSYEMRKWLVFSLGFSQEIRDSNQNYDSKYRAFGITTRTKF